MIWADSLPSLSSHCTIYVLIRCNAPTSCSELHALDRRGTGENKLDKIQTLSSVANIIYIVLTLFALYLFALIIVPTGCKVLRTDQS